MRIEKKDTDVVDSESIDSVELIRRRSGVIEREFRENVPDGFEVVANGITRNRYRKRREGN